MSTSRDDLSYLKEIRRVLKPGGIALITTPNIRYTLTRNPWHVREYLSQELFDLAKSVFEEVDIKGIAGSNKVMQYYEQNKQSVKKITRLDVLDLQHKLPAFMLRIPYDILNRLNRRKLNQQDNSLVAEITHNDYYLIDDATEGLDLFGVFKKTG